MLSEYAEFEYKTTDYYAPQFERCIIWNDKELAIALPSQAEPNLSAKDAQGSLLESAEVFA